MKKNMGSVDRAVRVVAALVVIVLFLAGQISGTAAIVLGIVAVVFMLTAFGHVDGKFSMDEKRFVQEKIAELVEKRMLEAVSDPLARHAQTDRVIKQFQKVAG